MISEVSDGMAMDTDIIHVCVHDHLRNAALVILSSEPDVLSESRDVNRSCDAQAIAFFHICGFDRYVFSTVSTVMGILRT